MLPGRDREGAVEECHLRIIAALVLILCLSRPGFAVEPKKSSTSSSHPAAAAAKRPAGKKGRRSRRAAARRKPAGQVAPTPERYQTIQQALVAKGYAPRTPDGVWGPEWASALKSFQQNQKLEATGKLNSMSLITLGLGPKREQPAGATAPPASPAPSATPPSSSSSTVRELK